MLGVCVCVHLQQFGLFGCLDLGGDFSPVYTRKHHITLEQKCASIFYSLIGILHLSRLKHNKRYKINLSGVKIPNIVDFLTCVLCYEVCHSLMRLEFWAS